MVRKSKTFVYVECERPIAAVITVMRAMGIHGPGLDGTGTFLQSFNSWYNSSGEEDPLEGLTQFFNEFRPQDDLEIGLTTMW